MSSIHPGLILIATGFLALILPQAAKKVALIGGAGLALAGMLTLKSGLTFTLPFINGYELYLLHVDELNWVFGLVFCIIAFGGAIYSSHVADGFELLCAMAYAGSALGVTLCGDWITLIFFWELMAIFSLFLIWRSKTEKATKAGWHYLLMHMLGGNLLLFGIVFKVTGGDFMVANAAAFQDAAFWLILCGVGINAAIPPLHGWMTESYPEATVTGSIFLSSFTTKVAVYCLIRIFAGTELLMWVGVIMALYGALFAIIENDMRRLLSYHIISQLGFMVAAIGIGTDLALNGAAAHAFSNILYKPLLFMCAGAIIYATGIKKINQLGGLHKKMPLVCLCFFVAAFSISGVPLFNGFTTKSIILTAACEGGMSSVELLLQLASVGTFLSIAMKMIYFIFFGEDRSVKCGPIPGNMKVAMGFVSALCIIFGVYPELLYQMLPFEMEYHPFTVDHVVQYVQLLLAAALPFMMYLEHMEPHSQLSLDTDWFYRKGLGNIVNGITWAVVSVQTVCGGFFKEVYEGAIQKMKNPMKYSGRKPRASEYAGVGEHPEEYDPNAYTMLQGEVILIAIGAMLVIMYFIFL